MKKLKFLREDFLNALINRKVNLNRSNLHPKYITHCIGTASGITLIALVVTIIVLLILAGVSLSLVSGTDGILNQATNSVDKSNLASIQEDVELAMGELQSKYHKARYVDGETTGSFVDYAKAQMLAGSGLKTSKGAYISLSGTTVTYTDKNGETTKGTINETTGQVTITGTPIAGKTASSSNRTLSGATTGYSYKNPVIPQGFSAVDSGGAWTYTSDDTLDEVTGWNDGLVITDGINEFVWVPVDGTNVTYNKWCTKDNAYSSCSDATDTQTVSGTSYAAIPVTESTQIATYGGFYVARYEAGSTNSSISSSSTSPNNSTYEAPVSQKGAKVWNNIDYNHAYAVADMMINDSTKYGNVKSGLITGTQWDTIMKWYKNSNIGIGSTDGLAQDWGSYINLTYTIGPGSYFIYNSGVGAWATTASALTHTGSNSQPYHFTGAGLNNASYKKNIADMAGNFWEWTAEVYSSYRVFRGGSADYGAGFYPASCRFGYSVGYTYYYLGFRCVLYVQ